MSTHLVFVFGTLKSGFPNFATNRGRRVPGRYATVERYPLHLVGERHSPWLFDLPGLGHQVSGELFEVDDQTLHDMDRLERVDQPDGYLRRTIDVTALDGAPATAAQQAHIYLRRADDLGAAETMTGPLPEYTTAHAALYRRRAS